MRLDTINTDCKYFTMFYWVYTNDLTTLSYLIMLQNQYNHLLYHCITVHATLSMYIPLYQCTLLLYQCTLLLYQCTLLHTVSMYLTTV